MGLSTEHPSSAQNAVPTPTTLRESTFCEGWGRAVHGEYHGIQKLCDKDLLRWIFYVDRFLKSPHKLRIAHCFLTPTPHFDLNFVTGKTGEGGGEGLPLIFVCYTISLYAFVTYRFILSKEYDSQRGLRVQLLIVHMIGVGTLYRFEEVCEI